MKVIAIMGSDILKLTLNPAELGDKDVGGEGFAALAFTFFHSDPLAS